MSLRWPGLKTSLFLAVTLFLLAPPVIDLMNGRAKAETGCHIMLVMDGDTLKMNCPDQGRVTARICLTSVLMEQICVIELGRVSV